MCVQTMETRDPLEIELQVTNQTSNPLDQIQFVE